MIEQVKYYAKKNYKLFFCSFTLSLLFFGINYIMEYATDTYATFYNSGSWEYMLYENGRVFNALIYYIIETLKIPNGYTYKLSFCFAFLFLTIAVWLFGSLLLNFCQNELLCSAISFMTIANIYSIEYFLFIEKGLFMLAILLCTLAAFCTIKYFMPPHPSKMYLFLTLLCLIWAVFIYQAILGLYVILCLPFILKYSRNIKQFFIFNLITASLYGIPLLTAYLIMRFCFYSSRMGSVGNIFHNIRSVFPQILKISYDTLFYIPSKILVIFFLILSVTFFVLLFLHRKEKNILLLVFSFLYLVAGTVFTGFFPAFSGISSDFVPRIIYPYGCMFGVLCVWLIAEYNFTYLKHYQYALGSIILLILGCQYLLFQSVFIERYKANEADRYYCEIIQNKIQEYEAETNITIDTICFYKDKSLRWFDMGLDNDMTPRSQSCGWSNLTSLNIYLYKDYKKGEPLAEYEEYFSQFNWDTYSEKQLIFQGNTLHLCVY